MTSLPNFIYSDASFSPCERYRYTLHRVWDKARPMIAAVLLNPSVADAFALDNTCTRVVKFADAWGFGALVVLNLFALRSTDPKALYHSTDPVGLDNDAVIREWAAKAQTIVCGWGNHGDLMNRGRSVGYMLRNAGVELNCWSLTKSRQPGHPLYLSAYTPLRPYLRA